MSLRSKSSSIKLLIYVQLGMLAALVGVAFLTLVVITRITETLEELSVRTLPSVIETSALNSKITQLATLTSQLSHASSDASRQNEYRRIEALRGTFSDFLQQAETQKSINFAHQLDIIHLEISELNDIIRAKIGMQTRLQRLANEVNQSIIVQSERLEQSNADEEAKELLLSASLGVANMLQQNNLHQVRVMESEIIDVFIKVKSLLSTSVFEKELSQLADLLITIQQFSDLKAESLKQIGRARGRTNFVLNLLEDARSNVDYQNQLINNQTLKTVEEVAKDSREQQGIIIGVAAVIGLFSLILIILLYKKVIARIILLTDQVNRAEKYEIDSVEIDGTDEIADLARVFNDFLITVKQHESSLLELSLSDPLTGVANRRALDRHLENTIAQATRYEWDIAILLIDIDYFKAFNDSYGHNAGDEALVSVAQTINNVVSRKTDICARFGGEEFACVLSDASSDSVKHKAKQILKSVEALGIENTGSQVSKVVTVSIGASIFNFNKHTKWTKEEMVINTDKTLYMAKKLGRNQFIFDIHKTK